MLRTISQCCPRECWSKFHKLSCRLCQNPSFKRKRNKGILKLGNKELFAQKSFGFLILGRVQGQVGATWWKVLLPVAGGWNGMEFPTWMSPWFPGRDGRTHKYDIECPHGLSFQINEELDHLASEYSFVEKIQIGESYEKRPLYVLKVQQIPQGGMTDSTAPELPSLLLWDVLGWEVPEFEVLLFGSPVQHRRLQPPGHLARRRHPFPRVGHPGQRPVDRQQGSCSCQPSAGFSWECFLVFSEDVTLPCVQLIRLPKKQRAPWGCGGCLDLELFLLEQLGLGRQNVVVRVKLLHKTPKALRLFCCFALPTQKNAMRVGFLPQNAPTSSSL